MFEDEAMSFEIEIRYYNKIKFRLKENKNVWTYCNIGIECNVL